MDKILITGGSGFIGSHLVKLFLNNGNSVCVVDNFSYGKREFLPSSGDRFSIMEGSITDLSFVKKSFATFNPDIVIHLAAIHHIPTCEQRPEEAIRVNIEGTQNVLSALKDIHAKRLLFASSGAVYDIIDGPLLEDTTPVMPYDVYSITKLAGEHLIRNYAARNSTNVIACRIFNCIGRHETNQHLVPEILTQVKEGKKEIQLGNFTPLRSYIHVEDVADAFFTLSSASLKKNYDVFNIGTTDESSVTDILHLISEIAGKQLVPVQNAGRMRKADRNRQKASIDKIVRATSWTPRRTLKQALTDAYNETIQAG